MVRAARASSADEARVVSPLRKSSSRSIARPMRGLAVIAAGLEVLRNIHHTTMRMVVRLMDMMKTSRDISGRRLLDLGAL